MCILSNYKTVNEWNQKNPIAKNPRRELIKMCVIDDEGFEKESLLNLKFGEIYVMDEFRNMNDFEHYNVILCDIKGVGSELDNQLEGIALAREIKKLYPDKIVIQYSGQAVHDYDPNFYQNMIIDGFVKKDLSTPRLAEEIDANCSMLWDPCDAWKYIEKNLRNLGVYNKNIAYFEHLYVKSLEKNRNYLDINKNDANLKIIKSISMGLFNLGLNVLNLYLELKK